MGFFKKLLGDEADGIKKNLEDTKKEMRNSLEEMQQNAKAGFIDSASKYAKKQKDCDSEVRLREMPEDKVSFYGGASERIPVEKTVECSDANAVKSNDDHPSEKETAFEFIHKLRGELVKANGNKGNSTEAYSTFDRLKQQYNCARELYLNGERSAEKIKEAIQLNLDKDAGKSNNDSAFQITAKKENNDNGGLFSARLEALIAAALQDGVLTDKEREILKRRVEKEGEDWDEVEMIIEVRLAEMNSVASAPSSETIENNNVSQEQAKAKEVPPLKVDKPISKRYVKTEEDKYATSIDIPEGVTVIPATCFYECLSLESITLPSTIKQIGGNAFAICSALTSIDIPEGVTVIPTECFWGCSSLESITLPSTIKQIGEKAFSNCSALTSIDIPEGVTIIPRLCFGGCSSLESITLPSTIKQIGEKAFSNCSALTSIDIPEGVTIIPRLCFDECKKLNSVTLPTTIKMIKDYAFDKCNKLKTISIPNGCERLKELGYFDQSPKIFLPPSLCSIDVISTSNYQKIYCFAPQLEELEIFENCGELYVLPQYLDSYKSQAEAEEVEIDIYPMPEEFLYYYDN